ncbi:PREP [Cordylochernes scorpioides]|uniref:PREP n=1 Tax=Cordylochernes scorpioides TaxID=51811 RepID=A0ABY6LG25_9ARAC|nr:PREP [Cordylochernes scorpioides]
MGCAISNAILNPCLNGTHLGRQIYAHLCNDVIDIRQFYLWKGQLKPGERSVQLTISEFSCLCHIPDPYHWLSDPDSEETKEFVNAQNEVTVPYLESVKERSQIKEKTSVAVHNTAVQHPLSTVSPDSNPTIMVLQTEA